MVRSIDVGGDEHYVGLEEAAAVPFENGRIARNIPAYRDIAHAGSVPPHGHANPRSQFKAARSQRPML